jgi:hypothetical protein
VFNCRTCASLPNVSEHFREHYLCPGVSKTLVKARVVVPNLERHLIPFATSAAICMVAYLPSLERWCVGTGFNERLWSSDRSPDHDTTI